VTPGRPALEAVRDGEARDLRVVPVARLDDRPPEQRWLIRSLLPYSAVGVIGGQPKCAKSYYGLDLAVSIASSTPCLGRYPVERPGRSMVFLAEDSPADLRDRVADLCLHRQIEIESLDLHVVAEPALHLDQRADRQGLWDAVERLRPLLVVLDPLVRLHTTLDENNSRDVAGLLGFLRKLQRTFDTTVILVHHTAKKGNRSRPGQALRGSGDLHAWLDVGAYLAWTNGRLNLTLEHRAVPAPEPVELALVSRSDGSATHLEVASGPALVKAGEPLLTQRILDQFSAEQPLRRGQLRERLRVNNSRLGDALIKLETLGLATKTAAGWSGA